MSESLYSLATAVRNSIEGAYTYVEDTGEIIWSPDDLEELNLALTDKAEGVIAVRQDYKLMAAKAKEEAKRLSELAKAYESKADHLAEYMVKCMHIADKRDIETPLGRLHLRPSKSVEVLNQDEVPSEYLKEKVTYTVDKTKAGKALDNGESIPGVARMLYDILEVK